MAVNAILLESESIFNLRGEKRIRTLSRLLLRRIVLYFGCRVESPGVIAITKFELNNTPPESKQLTTVGLLLRSRTKIIVDNLAVQIIMAGLG